MPSAPSSTRLATSVASARVGRGASGGTGGEGVPLVCPSYVLLVMDAPTHTAILFPLVVKMSAGQQNGPHAPDDRFTPAISHLAFLSSSTPPQPSPVPCPPPPPPPRLLSLPIMVFTIPPPHPIPAVALPSRLPSPVMVSVT